MTTSEANSDFVALVRKSGLVDDERLDACLRKLSTATRTTDEPTRIALALVEHGLLTRFQAEQILQGKCRGFNIGPYKILERLGSGGMALVYLCEDPTMQCLVAVKVLPNARAQDVEYLKRFYREARVAAGLDHPHIVRTFDVDHDGRVNYMVMEYVDGALLHDIVQKSGPLPIERAAHYIHQAALGLQHAHEAGLVHRDIKPGNLILDRSGTVKVLDMGLARNFTDDAEEVLTRGVIGTPDYLSPEQAVDSHNVDIRADIYSLGCSFYYLLTGGPPFPAEGSVAQKLLWQQTRQPTPVRAFRPEVPEGLAAVVHKMMAKKPEERYQTPAEIVEALAPWTETPIDPPTDDEMPRLSPAIRRTLDTVSDMSTDTPAVPVRVNPPTAPAPATPPPPRTAPPPPTQTRPNRPAPTPPLAGTPPANVPAPPVDPNAIREPKSSPFRPKASGAVSAGRAQVRGRSSSPAVARTPVVAKPSSSSRWLLFVLLIGLAALGVVGFLVWSQHWR